MLSRELFIFFCSSVFLFYFFAASTIIVLFFCRQLNILPLTVSPVVVQTLEGSARLLLAQLARLRVKLRIYFRRFSLIDLDELFDADRVVAVAIHEGEGLVAFLNSFHLLPVQLLS